MWIPHQVDPRCGSPISYGCAQLSVGSNRVSGFEESSLDPDTGNTVKEIVTLLSCQGVKLKHLFLAIGLEALTISTYCKGKLFTTCSQDTMRLNYLCVDIHASQIS